MNMTLAPGANSTADPDVTRAAAVRHHQPVAAIVGPAGQHREVASIADDDLLRRARQLSEVDGRVRVRGCGSGGWRWRRGPQMGR